MRTLSDSNNRIRLIIIGGALMCFAYVSWLVANNDVLAFDTIIRNWAYDQRGPVLNAIFITITYLGNWQTIVALALILLLLPKTRMDMGVPFAITAASSTIIYKIIKSMFQRPRPDLAVRIIEQGGYSFPSGHSMNCMVCYGILIYLIRRYCKNKALANAATVFFGLLILLIGTSRVYVGVHFPTDILGGWSLGAVVLTASIMIIEKLRGKGNDN